MNNLTKNLMTITLLVFAVVSLNAQDHLPTIKPEDYAKWQTLNTFSISDDGNWVFWNVNLVDGDDTLYIKNVASSKLYKCLLFQICKLSKMNSITPA